jgi:hypothetical protein
MKKLKLFITEDTNGEVLRIIGKDFNEVKQFLLSSKIVRNIPDILSQSNVEVYTSNMGRVNNPLILIITNKRTIIKSFSSAFHLKHGEEIIKIGSLLDDGYYLISDI